MKYSLFFLILVTPLLKAQVISSSTPAHKAYGKNPFIEVIKTIEPLEHSKKIYIQDNKIIPESKVDHTETFCYFENIRESDPIKKTPIKAKTSFKTSNDFGNGWDKYLGYRIWEEEFIGWGNGDYQFFSCESNKAKKVLTVAELNRTVGNYLKLSERECD